MANELQINANRLNAEKSTGPSTIEGKLKSSQNALRHGMLAQTIVLEGESSERFQLLLATLARLSQLNGFSNDFGGFPSDNSIHCNNSLSKTAAVKTHPLSL